MKEKLKKDVIYRDEEKIKLLFKRLMESNERINKLLEQIEGNEESMEVIGEKTYKACKKINNRLQTIVKDKENGK